MNMKSSQLKTQWTYWDSQALALKNIKMKVYLTSF